MEGLQQPSVVLDILIPVVYVVVILAGNSLLCLLTVPGVFKGVNVSGVSTMP